MMAEELRPGLTGAAELVTGPEHGSSRFGAGVDVFATAIMVGLMENAALNAVDHLLPEGSATVGMGMTFKHSAATPLGATVRARAELIEVDGRRLVFRIEAFDPWESIGTADHERFIIQRDRFIGRVQEKAARPAG
jgi:fluoroacetyl-CoA thioesterase